MAAAKFKAQCLAVLDEVQSKREPVLVTKNGRPVAKMVPLDLPEGLNLLDAFRFPGKIEIVGDIMAPLYSTRSMKSFLNAPPSS